MSLRVFFLSLFVLSCSYAGYGNPHFSGEFGGCTYDVQDAQNYGDHYSLPKDLIVTVKETGSDKLLGKFTYTFTPTPKSTYVLAYDFPEACEFKDGFLWLSGRQVRPVYPSPDVFESLYAEKKLPVYLAMLTWSKEIEWFLKDSVQPVVDIWNALASAVVHRVPMPQDSVEQDTSNLEDWTAEDQLVYLVTYPDDPFKVTPAWMASRKELIREICVYLWQGRYDDARQIVEMFTSLGDPLGELNPNHPTVY